ncbi:MAG TPA: hypothetical protein PK691_02310 [Thermomicrobiales bacterium]|nr:hypothetical protein [Thermomicrobiales bacterium]
MARARTGTNLPAPGGMIAPHFPGAQPDYTTVPAHVGEPTPPAIKKVRPLSQYGSAEEIVDVFTSKPMDQLQPSDFEQATASPEEMRKQDISMLTPIRPLPGPGSDPALTAGDPPSAISPGG